MTIETTEKLEIMNGQCPERLPNINEYEVEEEVVLYDPRSDAAHILNPTATVVWWLCDGDHKITDIARELGDLYDKEPDSVRPDVDEILSGFISAGVVRWK